MAKLKKNMKKIIISLLLLPFTIILFVLLKYNINLNSYLSNEVRTSIKNENKLQDNVTQVHIVGTFHYESNTIKREDFSRYIDSIAPSVILYEGSASAVKRILKRRDYFSQFMNALKKEKEIEKAVVLKYIKENPTCKVLPYEWELRDKYHRKHRLKKKSKKMLNSVIKLYSNKQLTKVQSATVERFLKFNKSLMNIENKATVYDINDVSTDSILKQRQNYIYKYLPEIVKEREELLKYLKFLPFHMEYWDLRNKAMAQNILKQIKKNSNKKIVVLNGFYHRYYLVEELKKYEKEYNFSVR